jgi:hypothetical protein
MAASLACGALTQATSTPTALAPTETVCPWIENPGPPPPEVEKRAQDAFAATGLPGTLTVTGEGEYTCEEFHLRSIGFEFTLDVGDLGDRAAMEVLVARVKDFPVSEILAGRNFDGIKIRFRSGDQFCWWDDVQGCGPTMPFT